MLKHGLWGIALLLAATLVTGGEPVKKVLTPEQQAAADILERYRAEKKVEKQQRTHEAAQRFRAGKAHLDVGAFQAAHDQAKRAVELDPTHKGAQDLLVKTRGLLGLRDGDVQAAIPDYKGQLAVVTQVRMAELRTLFERGKTQYAAQQYGQAIETFTRAAALARYLAPRINTSHIATESEVQIRKARGAAEGARRDGAARKRQKAEDEARRLGEEREQLADQRGNALFRQAETLYAAGNFRQAQTVCDALLLDDPAHGAAEALREKALRAAQDRDVTQVLARREVEVNHVMRQVDAAKVPQTALVDMPHALRNEVMNRSAQAVFGDKTQADAPWEANIRGTLQRKVSFDFVETPLQDVLSFLSHLTDTTIVLDAEPLADLRPIVTLRVNEMRFEAALSWICKLNGLKYGLRDEAIFISSPDRFGGKTVLRMYDVSDLTLDIPNFAGNHKALSTGDGHDGREGGGGGGIDAEGFWGPVEDEEDDDKLTGKNLILFIRKVFATHGWQPDDDEGGFIGAPDFTIDQGDADKLDGKALADIIAITVGGRTIAAVRTVE
ncbi:hypothetical protein HQ560_17720 [bacterium]|nr:hypothetical protein [bacterium]